MTPEFLRQRLLPFVFAAFRYVAAVEPDPRRERPLFVRVSAVPISIGRALFLGGFLVGLLVEAVLWFKVAASLPKPQNP